MFLLIILFGLAALGLALALYIQADMAPPLPPKPPPVTVQAPAAPPADAAGAVLPDSKAADSADTVQPPAATEEPVEPAK